jgi:hypothetical protein
MIFPIPNWITKEFEANPDLYTASIADLIPYQMPFLR